LRLERGGIRSVSHLSVSKSLRFARTYSEAKINFPEVVTERGTLIAAAERISSATAQPYFTVQRCSGVGFPSRWSWTKACAIQVQIGRHALRDDIEFQELKRDF
jgi:hypothetical protein